MSLPDPPMGLLAELTHRCPLQCPYCSNPLELERAGSELDTATWLRVLDEAAALGVLQVHFSGGEPTARKDLPALVRRAAERQMYSNLITSGVLLDAAAMDTLAGAGIDHVQLSFQDVEPGSADRIGGYSGGHRRKLEAAALIRRAGVPLTANFVVHRHNIARVPAMIALGTELGAGRIEIAHVQYYGWGLVNRNTLLPDRTQLDFATASVEEARDRLRGRVVIDYVTPDYHAARPKACMGGWARRFINISPAGKALPCHAAESLPGLEFPSVRDTALAEIWHHSPAFQRFRGTDWMPEPCRSCDRREIDWGGCRCQAFALTGDAARTDPACALAPDHALMAEAVAARRETAFTYRRIGAR
ncbi:MAG: pyrroloquinoline quinone biosynthesis protein PqqE [Acetobacteraceae bacterium]|nr:pyrroloquinoline quinone biosynthesis protein PqqE [Acetobacteraceae bacterium]